MPQEDIALLEALEVRGVAARRRAIWTVWGSVFAASLVLVVLVSSAYRQLADVKEQVETKQERLNALQREEERLGKQIANYRRQIANYKRIAENYQSIAAEQSEAARQSVAYVEPPPADLGMEIQPRVYQQIVAREDREYAETIAQSLEKAGFNVLGTEYVPKAAGLKNTEIRYYKKRDEEDARKLLEALQAATGKPATLLYLGLEKNQRVRPKHYEIWFADGAGSPGGEGL